MYNTQTQCIATESDSLSHSTHPQRGWWLSLAIDTWLRDSVKKVAESGSWHMAQGLSKEGGP